MNIQSSIVLLGVIRLIEVSGHDEQAMQSTKVNRQYMRDLLIHAIIIVFAIIFSIFIVSTVEHFISMLTNRVVL